MIELKNITKVYKGKGSSQVKALDDISFVLPEKGLVFILGKSGCGKSTLLNVLGGLDKPTSGEIVIKGKSSGQFSASDFDSYRNTYVGFIFQEYNVLPEFSVKENITLATELQGRKADNDSFTDVLGKVELEGLDKRKPTTLSGGQKQRVAIARALVKDPQIILADEPTGALDSNTGKAVLDLLKALSKNKLVVVVSHDREFANKYADRIIELHDGRILSDMSFVVDDGDKDKGYVVVGDDIHVSRDLDAEMLSELNALLRDRKRLTLTLEEGEIGVEGGHFVPTDETQIKTVYAPDEKLIRSKFPLRYAARMGASGLKTKRFRLILTVILSTIALTAFGFMLSLMTYNADTTLRNALEEGGQSELGVGNYRIWTHTIPVINYEYESTQLDLSDKARIDRLERQTGLEFLKVQTFSRQNGYYYGGRSSFRFAENNGMSYYYPTEFCGFASVDEEKLERFGGKLISGRLAQQNDEIVVSDLVVEAMYYLSARDSSSGELIMKSKNDDPIGKTITIGSRTLRICGVFSAPYPDEKFKELTDYFSVIQQLERNGDDIDNLDIVKRYYMLTSEIGSLYRASLSTLCLVHESFYGYGSFLNDYNGVREGLNLMLSDGEYGYYYMTAQSAAADDERISLLNGRTLKDGVLFSFMGIEELIEDLHSRKIIDDAFYNELASMINYKDGGQPEEIARKLDERYPSLFSNLSIQDNYGKVTVTQVVGVYNDFRDGKYKQASVYMSEEMYNDFFSMNASDYNAEDADFLLCVNTPEARRILTDKDLKETDDDGRRFMLYENYQSDAILEYSRYIAMLSGVFFWVGVVFAAFAALLLFTFISTSINYKKKDIGILRALGARKADVFKVFYSESMMIIGACYILAAIFSVILAVRFGVFLKEQFMIPATLFFFGPLQAVILGALAAGVAFISTILPVIHHAKKPPVDAIRAL